VSPLSSARRLGLRAPALLLLAVILFVGCDGGGDLRDMPLPRGAAVEADEDVAGSRGGPFAPGDTVAGSDEESERIREATVAYVQRETAIRDVGTRIEAVDGDWARVRVTPLGGETDPATLYLRREAGVWRGVAIGTAFSPPDLDELGVPPSVRPAP
jgi:hypothetical protein